MSASPESELTPLTGLKNGIHCEINVTSHIARHFSEAVSLCAVRRAARTDLVLSEKRLSAVVQLRSLHWDIGDVLKPRQFLSRKSLLQPHSAKVWSVLNQNPLTAYDTRLAIATSKRAFSNFPLLHSLLLQIEKQRLSRTKSNVFLVVLMKANAAFLAQACRVRPPVEV
ncbi:hypothetical protein PCANC_16533 [Puccinia coronata f. sp. avenae]|uniref:Uncharacterized protein n=1 Tax=Puccinia coronata f. sp. avenae TaxID=200324 RepID=A0A2N5SMP6_9BASI|nr:hypothetical protein PCASD_19547 [Puccinia coronata f. sp. avenae]PLW38600.1 hypothetical protein PCANC_16533 [Puccinia coronata f. sp. avenae]